MNVQVEPAPHIFCQTVKQGDEAPIYTEAMKVINKAKTHKASRADNVIMELLKNCGHLLWQRLHLLITRIWNEEKIPEAYSMGIIQPIDI